MKELDIAFNLLKSALDAQPPYLGTQPIGADVWWKLFRMMQRNRIAALASEAINMLPDDQRPPRDVLIPWPCNRLGIDDPQNATHVWNIAPNPTTGRITVTGSNDNGQSVRLEIVDATGRELLHTTGLSADLTPLGTGIYYIRIITDNNITVKKVVKN